MIPFKSVTDLIHDNITIIYFKGSPETDWVYKEARRSRKRLGAYRTSLNVHDTIVAFLISKHLQKFQYAVLDDKINEDGLFEIIKDIYGYKFSCQRVYFDRKIFPPAPVVDVFMSSLAMEFDAGVSRLLASGFYQLYFKLEMQSVRHLQLMLMNEKQKVID